MSADPLSVRQPAHPILDLLVRRWSPRAMSGEAISQAELDTLLEAARWAPSTYNEQEWRFLYALRGTPDFDTYLGLLMEANQVWCVKAGALVVVCSHKVFARNGKANPVHSFDTGAAFENLCLQATQMSLVAHGMAGFDRDKAREQLDVPDDFHVDAMIALGRPGDPADLPEDIREREQPSDRKPIAEISCAGKFRF